MALFRAAGAAALAGLLMPVWTIPPAAQEWNDARTMALVTRATERRARQLADTGLTDYTATALGSLTFLAQVGEGFPDPPKVVKADQIALEVYWRAPNHSKQWILGRRDTLLLPTDIQYHRDHLGIVQNNFPDIIRLGEGDEVRDVPHPLSAPGRATYDYAIRDSLRIGIPGRVIEVYEVQLRPKDDRRPAAVGAVYLDRADAQVVRMAFSFTRAALIDEQLEDVAIVLDNALVEERFWLPRRQDIEIRRTGTWLEFPARGIIRGRWEICCYRVNQGTPVAAFTGPEIQLAPPERRAAFRFEGPTRSIVPPDVAMVTGEDVARVQAEARELVRRSALARARRSTLVAGSVSDLARVTRAEGLSLGAGLRRRIGSRVDLALSGRIGLADGMPRGAAWASWAASTATTFRLGGYREVRDASDVSETSGLRNSIAAQEFGADDSEPFEARGLGGRLEWRGAGLRSPAISLELARERTDSLSNVGVPARGAWPDAFPAGAALSWRGELASALSGRPLWGGTLQSRATYRMRRSADSSGHAVRGRVVIDLRYDRQVGDGRLIWSTFAGATTSAFPQDQLRAGGPVTGPGYGYHQFASRGLLSQRLEWQSPIAFPSIPLSRWGRTPAEATLAPFTVMVVQQARDSTGARRTAGFPAVGVGLIAGYGLLRIDLARGLRGGRWRIGVDVTRELWPIL